MKSFLKETKYLYFFLFLMNILQLKAEEFPLLSMPDNQSQILIESNSQSSDLENSIFYAEGDVMITNTDKEFVARSNKAIFYKSSSKIKLIGNVEVTTNDSSNQYRRDFLLFKR